MLLSECNDSSSNDGLDVQVSGTFELDCDPKPSDISKLKENLQKLEELLARREYLLNELFYVLKVK